MSSKQIGFDDYERSTAKKRTKRERFLAEMEAVTPWKALVDLVEPHYPTTSSKGGRPPYPSRDDAAGPSAAEVVRPQRSSDGGCVDRGAEDAPLCRYRPDHRSDP